ncbi:flagellar filament capping protein FliD [Aidingimonas halophila]|uniref:Flagellar hook-associated protein 2 n=1 Tax=Aidingimonas halophila TaxID=574349 RepID=A0A1H3GBU2_9GAMM|nr:flagellar filament capping protein FliD [Aidingimonas halophila]GHC32943.1 flagellar hook-associated protein 2 [Aidingimonas halophila]SDY00812.1 flagellar hook-associated protein 2 [Aidingimonas halophila]
MSTIQSLGVGSGLDLNGLLDQLRAAEEEKLQPIEEQKSSYEAKISAYGELESSLSEFQSSLSSLNDPETFTSMTSEASGSAVDVAANSEASPGTYDVDVNALAQAHSLAADGVEDRDASLENGAGTLSLETAGGETMDIAIDADSSLSDIRDAINAENGAISASIVNDGSDKPHRLVLTSKDTGADSEMNVSFDGGGIAGDILQYGNGDDAMTETVGAQNADLTVNGIDITSQSNTVENGLEGVTLDLQETGSSKVTVEQDTESIKDAVTDFVDNYNALQDTMGELTAFDSESGEAAELMGDSTLRGIQTQLRSALSGGVEGEDGALSLMSDVGISMDVDGRLSLDDAKLDEVIETDQETLVDFFAGADDDSGMAGLLDARMETVLGPNGSLETATNGLNTRIDGLNDRAESVQRNIDNTMARYQEQFAQMDSMVSEMNSTSSYLSQQLGGGGGGLSSLM